MYVYNLYWYLIYMFERELEKDSSKNIFQKFEKPAVPPLVLVNISGFIEPVQYQSDNLVRTG